MIGSSPKFEFEEREGASVIVRKAELGSFNDKEAKPANIELHIGQRPVVAVGNSDGDLAMLTYAADRDGPSLAILVHHDDQEREYDYDKGTEKALEVAKRRNWTVPSSRCSRPCVGIGRLDSIFSTGTSNACSTPPTTSAGRSIQRR